MIFPHEKIGRFLHSIRMKRFDDALASEVVNEIKLWDGDGTNSDVLAIFDIISVPHRIHSQSWRYIFELSEESDFDDLKFDIFKIHHVSNVIYEILLRKIKSEDASSIVFDPSARYKRSAF